jgi:hypothetical protein
MENEMSRRKMIASSVAVLAATAAGAQTPAPPPPRLPDDLVRDFVIAGHGDLDKVKLMLEDQPRLLNATWDWGNGDFEMAIGGAGHMGRRDIAEFLISKGGRYDLFVAAMLDEIDLVKQVLGAHPELAWSLGPHGIPLIVHAQHGKAARVLEFLGEGSRGTGSAE